MDSRSKRLWVATLANVAVASLLILVLYGIMLALAVLAPEISGWPLYVVLALGIALSLIALRFAKAVSSRAARRVAYIVNGCALLLHLTTIFGLVALLISSTRERFLIPDGYKGDVYVVYGASDGERLSKTHSAVTYRIPKDGILRVQGPMARNWTRTEYDYQTETGKLERIRNFWPTTIHPTPENLANDRDYGVYFPRTGGLTDEKGCTAEYQFFYVGTKAHLLTKYKQVDISAYLQQHPLSCTPQQK